MSKFKTWKEFEKELNFSEEETEQMNLEKQLIEATIEARKKAEMTQRELGEKANIRQPSIAKIESFTHSPQVLTLIKLLYPLGYTLKVVPLKKKK